MAFTRYDSDYVRRLHGASPGKSFLVELSITCDGKTISHRFSAFNEYNDARKVFELVWEKITNPKTDNEIWEEQQCIRELNKEGMLANGTN